MRLPFLQVSQEEMARARTLAGYLCVPYPHALGMVVALKAAALEAAPEDDVSGAIRDPNPAEWMSVQCGWPLDRADALATALVRCGFAMAGPQGGHSVAGMEPYARALDTSGKRSEAGRKGAEARKMKGGYGRAMAGPQQADGHGVARDAKTQTQTQTQTQKKEEALSAAADLQVPLLQVAKAPGEQPEDLQALWNAEAHPSLPRWQGMSDTRKRRAAARLREKPLQTWREVIRRLSASPFCRGEEGGTGWKASPDWILQPDVGDKVLEGKYDRPEGAAAARPARSDTSAGRGGTQAECAGCGEQGECAGAGQGVLLGYACRCMGAWTGSGLDYTAAAEWARNRRAGRAA